MILGMTGTEEERAQNHGFSRHRKTSLSLEMQEGGLEDTQDFVAKSQ